MSSKDDVDLKALFISYVPRVEALYDSLQAQLDQHLPPEVLDYRRCTLAIKKHVAEGTLRFMLQLLGTDPDQQLGQFLTRTELAEVMSMSRRSANRVDRIIALLDEEHVCTPEIRQLFYERFKVRGQTERLS